MPEVQDFVVSTNEGLVLVEGERESDAVEQAEAHGGDNPTMQTTHVPPRRI